MCISHNHCDTILWKSEIAELEVYLIVVLIKRLEYFKINT